MQLLCRRSSKFSSDGYAVSGEVFLPASQPSFLVNISEIHSHLPQFFHLTPVTRTRLPLFFDMLATFPKVVAAFAIASSISSTLGETVVLANCQDSSGKWSSSQIAYFSGGTGSNPNAIAVVPGTNGGTVYWEGRTVSATFADGNVFTSHIRGGDIADYAYAGPGENKYTGFYCYHHWQPNLYQSSGGSCGQVYWCDHNAPKENVKVDFEISGDTVNLQGDFNPYDVYGHVWERMGTPYFDTSSVKLTDLCTISFSGHQAADNANHNMAQTLQDVVGRRSEAAKKTTSTVCTKWINIEHGQKACAETGQQTVTTMPKEIKLNAVNVPFDGSNNNDAGQLTATITCIDPAAVDCNMCKGLGIALGALSLLPEIGAIWGVAGAAASAACAGSGC